MFRLSCLRIWWSHDIWISEKLKSDFLKIEKSYRSEIKKKFFLISKVLSRHFFLFQKCSFRHTKNETKKWSGHNLQNWINWQQKQSFAVVLQNMSFWEHPFYRAHLVTAFVTGWISTGHQVLLYSSIHVSSSYCLKVSPGLSKALILHSYIIIKILG